MNRREDIARRIADCLEEHLPKYQWDPYRYRYPGGENKSVLLVNRADYSKIELIGADNHVFSLLILQETDE